MRRSVLVVGVVSAVLAAALGLVTNYASAQLPAFFAADPLRVWLVFGLLVLAAVVVTLIGARLGDSPSAEAATPAYGTGADSSRPPTLGVAVRGRHRELRQLSARDARGLVVLAGAGGMGKTTLAVAAADAARRHGRRVYWLRFRDGEQLTGRMLEVAEQLGLPRARIADAQRAGASLPDLVWTHLDRTRGWVIVLDNADRPAATCPSGDPVAEYRGWVRPGRRGLLLVTSRDRTSWGPRAVVIPVGPLDPQAGARALRDLAPSGGDDAAARRLATRLGGLPLALQAAALAVAAPTGRYRTFAAYAAALEARTASLLPDLPDVEDPDIARRLVGYTWELSLDQLAQEGLPLARPVLRLLALCADAPVPRRLVGPAMLDGVVVGPVTEAAVDGALAGLDRYGLVDAVGVDGVPAVALHPVVRESAVAMLAAECGVSPWRQAVDKQLMALAEECAKAGRAGWDLARVLAPHVPVLAGLDEPADGDREAFLAARVTVDRLADLLDEAGAYRAVAALRARLLDAETAHLGRDHLDVLATRTNLANALADLGEPREAADLHRAALTAHERDLGPDHPDTLASRNNLAIALHQLGEHRQAADLLRAALAAQERKLGPDHPDTLGSRNNLAVALYNLGEHRQAADLLRAVLTARERILGPDHPDTLASRNNLAGVLRQLGQNREAAHLNRAVLTARERILGPDHPDTLASRNNLANALGDLGEHRQAADLLRAVLTARERILGPDHPDTIASRDNLAVTEAALARYHWRFPRRRPRADAVAPPTDPTRATPPQGG